MTVDVHIKQEADDKTTVPFNQYNVLQPMQEHHPDEPTIYAQPQEVQFAPAPQFAYHLPDQTQNCGFVNGQYASISPAGSTNTLESQSPTRPNAVEQVERTPEPKGKRAKRGERVKEAEDLAAEHAAQPAWQGNVDLSHSPDHEAPTLVERSGPMMKPYVLRGKAKPGRKPVQGKESDDKRRVQNRVAQRKFRSKNAETQRAKDAEIKATREDLREAKTYSRLVEAENRQVYQVNEQLVLQLKAARTSPHNDRIDSIMPLPTAGPMPGIPVTPRQLQTHGPYAKFVAPPTPPEIEMCETDFTNFGRIVPQATSSSSDLGPSGLVDDPCGFCTDAQNCACKQYGGPEPESNGPGNCAACIANPQRAQACRQLAASSTLYPNFRPLHSGDNGKMFGGPGVQHRVRSDSHSGRMSCEQLMDSVESSGQPLTSIPEVFSDRIRAYPTASGRYEVERHEAAEALQALATRHLDFSKAGKS